MTLELSLMITLVTLLIGAGISYGLIKAKVDGSAVAWSEQSLAMRETKTSVQALSTEFRMQFERLGEKVDDCRERIVRLEVIKPSARKVR